MTTSVIMAVCDEPYLEATLNALSRTAAGKIEFVLGFDGTEQAVPNHPDIVYVKRTAAQVGRRVMINHLTDAAAGDFVYQVDPHCELSSGWAVSYTHLRAHET